MLPQVFFEILYLLNFSLRLLSSRTKVNFESNLKTVNPDRLFLFRIESASDYAI